MIKTSLRSSGGERKSIRILMENNSGWYQRAGMHGRDGFE